MEPVRKKAAPGRDPFEAPNAPHATPLRPGWLCGDDSRVPVAARLDQGFAQERSAWQRLAGTCSEMLRSLPAGAHPLAASACLRGATPAELRQLVRRFRTAMPRHLWSSRAAAAWHVEQLFPRGPWPTWDAVRGMHVVLGAAGAGKSTLVFKLALALRRAGRRASLLAFAPTPPEAARFAATARALGFEHAVVDAARGLPRTWPGDRTILVDTPCFLSRPEVASELLPGMRSPAAVLHYVLCPHQDSDFVARQLDSAGAHGVEHIAVTQLDLVPSLGMLLGPQMRRKRRLSFLNAGGDVAVPPLGLDPQALLRACGALTSGARLP